MEFDWGDKKNDHLQKTRDISFNTVVRLINKKKLLDEKRHHDTKKYPNQRLFIIEYRRYCYVVPYEIKKQKIKLITIYPSRKATKRYLLNNKDEEKK